MQPLGRLLSCIPNGSISISLDAISQGIGLLLMEMAAVMVTAMTLVMMIVLVLGDGR